MNQEILTSPSKDHYDALFNTIVENPLFLNKMKEIFDKNEFEKLGNDI